MVKNYYFSNVIFRNYINRLPAHTDSTLAILALMSCIGKYQSHLFCIFLFLLFHANAFGREITPRDSLLNIIENPLSPDTLKLDAYMDLVSQTRKSPKLAFLFIRSGQDLAEKMGSLDSYWKLEYFKGKIHFSSKEYEEATQSYKMSIDNAYLTNNKVLEARASNSLGILYGSILENDSSLSYFMRAARIWEELGNTQKLGSVYNNLGAAYSNHQDFATALSYYRKALFLPNSKRKPKSEGILLGNIGLMYLRLENYEKAKEYFMKNLSLAEELGESRDVGLIKINLGSVYYYQNDYANAFKYLQEGTEECMKVGYEYPIARGFRYMGKLYEAQEKYSAALSSYLQAAQYEGQHHSADGETRTLIAKMYFFLGNNSQALGYAHRGLELAKDKEIKENAAQACDLLSSIYQKDKQYDKALIYIRRYTEYKLGASSEKMESELLELQTRFETEQREKELVMERKKVEEQEAQIYKESRYRKNLLVLLASLGVLLAFALAFAYRLQETYKKLKRLNLAIQEQHEQLNVQANELKIRNQDLEKFSMALGHDLKQPLTTIKGYASLLSKTIPKIIPMDLQNVGTYLFHLNKGVERMEARIENLLKFYRTGAYMNQHNEVDLNKVLEDVRSDLHQAIEESQARIQYDQLPRVKGDPDLYAQLFQNLISNSIKYSKPHTRPEIAIEPMKNGRYWKIAIQDNGIGIEKDYLPGVFDLFSRVNSSNGVQGQGIGLATCKRIIELHGGAIAVDSSPGLGTTFTLSIPLSRN